MNTKIELLEKKIIDKAHKVHGKVTEQAKILLDQSSMLQDYIVPTSKMFFNSALMPDGDKADGIRMRWNGNDICRVHDNALGQLAGTFNIPFSYLKGLTHSGNKDRAMLSAYLLGEHASIPFMPDTRKLVRVVNGEVRAVLSDKYKRYDSLRLLDSFLNAVKDVGCHVMDIHAGEVRNYVEVVRPKIFEVETEHNGIIPVVVGCQFGNSDFGKGALSLRAYLINVVCMNGMIGRDVYRRVHLGSRLSEDINLSEKTIKLDTETTISYIKDAVDTVFSEEVINEEFFKIKQAGGKLVDMPSAVEKLPKIGMAKDEAESVMALLLENDPGNGLSGGATYWKLVQAITAVARDMEVPERKRELQEVANGILEKLSL